MAEGRMNLAALQQRDPYISEILDTASQVALYSFNSKSNEWEKTSIEGSLFIYKRSASPVNGFMILNRLGLNNLIEPITKDLEFQQQDPFLLYRNAKSIYGVWFYDKDECKRLGHKLNNYVQDILAEQQKKEAPAAGVVGGATARHPGSMAGMMPASQVDIMQMLSKAQQEYDTGSKKTEPKPMIDNPNAAATKSNNLIRPQPLKMPDTDAVDISDDAPGSVTPGTGIITLDALFRTASLQQGTSTQKTPSASQTQIDSYFQAGIQEHKAQRSSAAPTGKPVADRTKPDSDDLPPLLKHIMSTGSMVEDIERQHIPGVGDGTGDDGTSGPAQLTPGIPDLTQPPPNHPAYRGPSPQARKSPMDMYSGSGRPKSASYAESVLQSEKGPSNSGIKGTVPAPRILSGNLLPVFGSSSTSSQPSNAQSMSSSKKLSPETIYTSRKSPKGDADTVARPKVDPTTVLKSAPLLTPADLLQSSSSLASSSVSSSTTVTTTTTSHLPDKPMNPNFAAAAASLTTELLSPMAFISSSVRKTPPATSVSERSSSYEEKVDHSKDSDVLPVAALTKEQLQQALIYLLKNDISFISTIHEAYLKSLQELSGQKS
ncbi:mRNA-decapping enzyme 1A-like [Mercenaria mercenaria]|uniref:mRNA-decapping enzyme 1A-like n=1 Tax=Mercenaria mercenaria TaxID=6596 RepID=UPI00234E7A0F|nr:mRNA-decapping enzyme 1A-like [Mercenaria mercenaria]